MEITVQRATNGANTSSTTKVLESNEKKKQTTQTFWINTNYFITKFTVLEIYNANSYWNSLYTSNIEN